MDYGRLAYKGAVPAALLLGVGARDDAFGEGFHGAEFGGLEEAGVGRAWAV